MAALTSIYIFWMKIALELHHVTKTQDQIHLWVEWSLCCQLSLFKACRLTCPYFEISREIDNFWYERIRRTRDSRAVNSSSGIWENDLVCFFLIEPAWVCYTFYYTFFIHMYSICIVCIVCIMFSTVKAIVSPLKPLSVSGFHLLYKCSIIYLLLLLLIII